LIDIVKSYSDQIEKDFYLKEIARLLDISGNLVYDSYSRAKFQILTQEKVTTVPFTTEENAIGYILYNPENIKIFREKCIFLDQTESFSDDFINILNNGTEILQSLSLEKKEKYRGLALKIEEDNKEKTPEHQMLEVKKIADALNKEIFKKRLDGLKSKMTT
jgi:hypothetical protein